MKKYHVQITDEALQDMEDIFNHIAYELEAPENASSQYDRIAAAILSLEMFPEKYRVLDIKQCMIKQLRRMVIDSYSVLYVIDKDRVIITNVLYSASNLEARLNPK